MDWPADGWGEADGEGWGRSGAKAIISAMVENTPGIGARETEIRGIGEVVLNREAVWQIEAKIRTETAEMLPWYFVLYGIKKSVPTFETLIP